MKPRNNYEKRVARLNATLSEDISVKDMELIKQSGNRYGWFNSTHFYFTITMQMEEFKVARLYRAYKFADRSTEHYFFVEILRSFSDGERHLYFGKQRTIGAYYDCFIYHSDMELRGNVKNFCGYCLEDMFDLSSFSHSQQGGQRVPCIRIDPKELARIICNNPIAETMHKQHDPMLGHLMYRTYVKQTCRAYVIAKRHGFVFNAETIPLWLDMVYAIIVCKKDWHNPVYVAPKDLMATHDRFISMMIRKQHENRLAREYKKIQDELERNKDINEKYVKRRRRFYDMVLTDGLIECRVLRDVEAFREEGIAMEHCVYKCRYFEKPYSLILSARINGERVETIEVDLTNYNINQCYGKHDQFTMYHQRILDLVNGQMDIIKAYNNKTNKHCKAAV